MLPHHGVKCAEGFVYQQHLRIGGERPRQRDALLHATRQFVHVRPYEFFEADKCEILVGDLAPFGHG